MARARDPAAALPRRQRERALLPLRPPGPLPALAAHGRRSPPRAARARARLVAAPARAPPSPRRDGASFGAGAEGTMSRGVAIFPVAGMPEVRTHDDLVGLIASALARLKERLVDGDVLVVAQKVVSKSEGRVLK